VVILRQTPKEQARQIAVKLHDRVASYPFRKCDRMPHQCITISIGVASSPEDGTTADTLLHHADQMLYQGKKKRGLNFVGNHPD
jgi:diguanylate cyclase (GGDEF)-like protein